MSDPTPLPPREPDDPRNARDLANDGCVLVRGLVDGDAVLALIGHAMRLIDAGGKPNARNLLDDPGVVNTLAATGIARAVRRLLGRAALAYRAILFDKTPERNWGVGWHQDRAIAVAERVETPGYGPWSVKAGVVHVEPPRAVLERCLAVRLHLDPTDTHNGPLRVIPGSHRVGPMPTDRLDGWLTARQRVVHAEPGDALLMRPLLLHASSRVAPDAGNRRIIHLEWSAAALPAPLAWATV